MVSVGVSWSGKTDVFFIDPQKTKVDQNCYIDLLKTSLLPECRRLYVGNDFEFLQSSVPSHRAKVTQQFLRLSTPDFIAADEWASYSPDLNSLDYCIWNILRDLVHEGRWLPFPNLRDLKEAIKNKWKEVTIETVRKSIAQWKNDWMRLESRIEAHFSLLTVTGHRSHAVRPVKRIGDFVRFGHPILFCVFHCHNKKYNVIISRNVRP